MMEEICDNVMKKKSGSQEVMDGSDIMELVGNEQVFSNFVDHKFQELDKDCDGKLSVKELQPAVADIGAALGLPARGSSPDSDHIYSEVSLPPFFLFFLSPFSTRVTFLLSYLLYAKTASPLTF